MSAEIIDQANELAQRRLELTIHNMRINHNAVSATHCCDCGEEIPERRREEVAGCQRCAECQEVVEQRGKHRRWQMFKLIQRGQIFADSHGWPVLIHSCDSQTVRYWRQGRINTASMDRFNTDFEPLSPEEAHQIRAELEQSEHIKKLRAQRAA